MLIKTKGIVLHRSAYNDRYCIVHLYTEGYGRLGVLQPIGRTRRSGYKSLLSPLSEVELVGELKKGKQLVSIVELRLYRPNYAIQQQPIKCSQAIFISELLYRVLTEDFADESTYRFVSESLYILHCIERGLANFYLCFTYQLLHYLAIEPTIDELNLCATKWFDLGEARFTSTPHVSSQAIPPSLCPAMCRFVRMRYDTMHRFRYSRHERATIIDYLLLYYRLHLPHFGQIKSLEILRSSSQTLGADPYVGALSQ